MATMRESTGLLMAAGYYQNSVASHPWAYPVEGELRTRKLHKAPILALASVLLIFMFSMVYLEPKDDPSGNRRQLKDRNLSKSSTRELLKARVIPDVFDKFVPSVGMKVTYKNRTVTNGMELTAHDLTPFFVGSGPTVAIEGSTSKLYTLIFVDPDAPSPDSRTAGQYLHLIYVNIPGQSSIPDSGENIVKYTPPNPPIGLHRYVIALFEQKEKLTATAPQSFSNFEMREYAEQYDLNLPVAAVYFLAKKADGPISEPGSEPIETTAPAN